MCLEDSIGTIMYHYDCIKKYIYVIFLSRLFYKLLWKREIAFFAYLVNGNVGIIDFLAIV